MTLEAYPHAIQPAAPGQPLVFLFHGTGGDENQLVSLGRELMPRAGIVSPRGDVSEYGAARFFRRTGEGRYDMDDLARATVRMEGFLRAHVEKAKPSQVIGLGYSNGANILAATSFIAPDLFDIAVLMHPLIPFTPEFSARPKTRYLITAGRHDQICPASMTTQLEEQLLAAHAPVTLFWHEGGHELRPQELAFVAQDLAAAQTED